MTKLEKRNKYFFGLGTVGRDMFYAFEANALLYYLSNVLSLPVGVFAAASMVLTVLRILDALNDPIMGNIIERTRTTTPSPASSSTTSTAPGASTSRPCSSAR